MRQRMGCSEILLKRHAAHRGGDQHVAARIEVGPVGDGRGQRVDDEPDALECDAVAHRLKRRRRERLDAVGESVESGGGGQPGWQSGGQFRVEKNTAGEKFRVKVHSLAVGAVRGDHAAAADLATGAGGGGHGDERQQPAPVGFPVVVGELELWLFDEDAADLGGVECAASAEADDAVASLGQCQLGRATGVGFGGIGLHVGVQKPVAVRLAGQQGGGEFFVGIGREQPGIGYDQWPVDAQCEQCYVELRDGARADPGVCREVEGSVLHQIS